MRRPAGLALFALAALAMPGRAQPRLEWQGYALGVGAYAAEGELTPAGNSLVGRARLMPTWTHAAFRLEVAYEHILTRRPRGGGFSFTAPGGSAPVDWLGADWTIHSDARTTWRHRFDRAAIGLEGERLEVTVGRQAISWATTLFLTPADPFAPFDPSDPFREYRAGVDAVRARAFLGPFTEIEGVWRVAESVLGTRLTALARAQTSLGGWAVGAWGGALHEEAAGAVFGSGALGATAVRTEVSLRESPGDGTAVRAALGIDRSFLAGDREVFLVAEVQYDGFGAAAAEDLLAVALSRPFVRGEMQVLGRWTAAGRGSVQVHPLVGVDLLLLSNLGDGSLLVAPGVSWSATSAISVRAGAYAGSGEGLGTVGLPGSEYGLVPSLGYVAVSGFF